MLVRPIGTIIKQDMPVEFDKEDTVDVGKSFSFIFEDPNWSTKVLVGALLILVSMVLTPILIGLLGILIVSGYTLEVVDNVRRGRQYPLPEWRDKWGEWLVLGLKLAVASFIWSLPALVLAIPLLIASPLLNQASTAAQTLGALLIAGFGCLTFIWILVLVVVQPAIYIRLAESGELSSALRFADIVAFTRDHIGDVIIAVIVAWIASLIVSMVGLLAGTVLCLVGLIIAVPAAIWIAALIQAHLFAQVGLSAQGQEN